jgi:uncharacterized membrane protein YidH (DUF202 family)
VSNRPRFHRARKQKAPPLTPPKGRKQVDAYSAVELHQMLVTDGVERFIGDPHPKPRIEIANEQAYLAWFVLAIQRIAVLDRIGIDAALMRVNDECVMLCGRPLRVG